jgi:hypothetical protein
MPELGLDLLRELIGHYGCEGAAGAMRAQLPTPDKTGNADG